MADFGADGKIFASSVSGLSLAFRADGEGYAILLGPITQDFCECVAAIAIPFIPQIVVRDLILESAEGMTAVDRSQKPLANVLPLLF